MSDSGKAQKTTIAPMLSVRGGAKAVDFYKTALGAAELFRLDAPDGAVVAQLSVGEAEFWVSDESPKPQLQSSVTRRRHGADGHDGRRSRWRIRPGNCGRSQRNWPVHDEYGWRIGRVVDPFGHHWEIGKPLPEGS